MNLQYLAYVVESYRCGSINKAAQNLCMSQPNLSTVIRNFESELGFQIFMRKNSGIEITPEGRMLLLSAELILSEVEKIKRIPNAFLENRNLSVSCTYSSALMQSFLDFKKNSPAGKIQDAFKETGLIQTMRDVVEQKYRLSIMYCFNSMYSKHKIDANKYNLKMELIGKDIPVVAIVSRRNPLSKKKNINIDELQHFPFATYENFDFDDWLGPLGIQNSGNILFVFDRGGLVDTVRNSNYISIVIPGVLPNGCAYLPIVGTDLKLGVYLLSPKSYQLNLREKQLIKHLKRSINSVLTIDK